MSFSFSTSGKGADLIRAFTDKADEQRAIDAKSGYDHSKALEFGEAVLNEALEAFGPEREVAVTCGGHSNLTGGGQNGYVNWSVGDLPAPTGVGAEPAPAESPAPEAPAADPVEGDGGASAGAHE